MARSRSSRGSRKASWAAVRAAWLRWPKTTRRLVRAATVRWGGAAELQALVEELSADRAFATRWRAKAVERASSPAPT